MKFKKIKFNSHKTHNTGYDILEGHISDGTYITYYINLKTGGEGMEYYTGSNYGGTGKSYSRNFASDKIPPKYKSAWLELKKIYETEYRENKLESVIREIVQDVLKARKNTKN